MPDDTLFPVGDVRSAAPVPAGAPRVQHPVRNQVQFHQADLDSLLEPEHQVRSVWAFVSELDASLLLRPIRACEGHPGRTPIDPRILLALWLYATLRGVGSARALETLCSEHIAYQWICGGVSVNYHTLADFRSHSAEVLEDLLINCITALRAAGLVTMDRVAHDGLRVRAHAASGSFRGQESLLKLRQEAEEQVEVLRRELEEDPAAGSRRQQAARKRAADERLQRINEALAQLPQIEAAKKDPTKKARASVTDASARTMKMPNGGFNPAYNIQLSADTKGQFIVGVGVSLCGSDHALLPAAVDQVRAFSGCAPKELLTDAGFAKPENVERLSQEPYSCTVYAPPTRYRDKDGNVRPARPDEAPAIRAWRARMESDQGKAIYKERAATIECVNALARNRGLQQLPVRGPERVKAVVLLFALAHNMARAASLRAAKPTE